jgi:hypothetical protein
VHPAATLTVPPSNNVLEGVAASGGTPLTSKVAIRFGVSGTYPKSMTIASQADIVVTGNLTGSGDAVLGLIANNFVRVVHPVSRSGNACENAAGRLQDVRVIRANEQVPAARP